MAADRSFIDALDATWSSIAGVLAPLPADVWDLPTDCPGWTVRDNVSHMIGTESSLLGRAAPPAAPAGLPHVHNMIGELNEAWVIERRALPGATVLDEFRAVTAARLDALRAMTDEQLTADSPSPLGTVPYVTFMDVRVMDCWVHEQDIRRAVGVPGGMDSLGARFAVRRFEGSIGFVVGKRAGAPDGTTVVIDVTGPAGRKIAVQVVDGRAKTTTENNDPTVHITTDVETFCCLVAGRWTAAQAGDRVTIAGDTALGEKIVANLATIP